MLKRMRSNLNYANVMSTLAVFIALGGTSFAALHLTGRDIRDGSLTGRDLEKNSLGGRPIKESRLERVPLARNAQQLNGLTAARLLVKCPRDTVPVSDVCVEKTARAPAPYTLAAGTCEIVNRPKTPGRRLPSHDELMTAIGDYGITLTSDGELTRNVYPSTTDPGGLNALVVADPAGRVEVVTNTAAGARPFRCVTDPLN